MVAFGSCSFCKIRISIISVSAKTLCIQLFLNLLNVSLLVLHRLYSDEGKLTYNTTLAKRVYIGFYFEVFLSIHPIYV